MYKQAEVVASVIQQIYVQWGDTGNNTCKPLLHLRALCLCLRPLPLTNPPLLGGGEERGGG